MFTRCYAAFPPIALATFVAAAPVAPRAQSPGMYSVRRDISDGVLNLRTGSATTFPILVGIPAGSDGVFVALCNEPTDRDRHPWCKATWKSQSGWLSSCCIVKQTEGDLPPPIEVTPFSTPYTPQSV